MNVRVLPVMKICGYILAFSLILLAAVPCCVVDDCPNDKMEQTEQHENGDEDCGSCSPFFSCEGCSMATVAYQPIQFEFISFHILPIYPSYQQTALPEVEIAFWQPPKLS
jgi:hypothetical protein